MDNPKEFRQVMVTLLAPFHCIVGAIFAYVVYRFFDLRNMLDLAATLSAASFAIVWGLVRNRPWTIWIQLVVCVMLYWLYIDGAALLHESERIGHSYELSAAPYIGLVGDDHFFGLGIALCVAELGSFVALYMARAEKAKQEPLRSYVPTPGEIYLLAVLVAAVVYCDLYKPSSINQAIWDRQAAIAEKQRQQFEESKAQAQAMEEYRRSGKAEKHAQYLREQAELNQKAQEEQNRRTTEMLEKQMQDHQAMMQRNQELADELSIKRIEEMERTNPQLGREMREQLLRDKKRREAAQQKPKQFGAGPWPAGGSG